MQTVDSTRFGEVELFDREGSVRASRVVAAGRGCAVELEVCRLRSRGGR